MAITNNWEWGFLIRDLNDKEETERWQKVIKHIRKKKKHLPWWQEVESEIHQKITHEQYRRDEKRAVEYGEASPRNYSALPGGELEYLKTRVQQLRSALSSKEKQLAEKRQDNEHLNKLLMENQNELRQREEVEQKRVLDLQEDI